MKVKLIVVGGKNAGKEVPVSGDRFLIGREEGCQLRAGHETISRKHGLLSKRDGGLWVKDLGSRTGTFVNDQKISAETELHNGDKLRIGPLEFSIRLEYDLAGEKQAKVQDIRDVVARTAKKAETRSNEDELDLASMLDDEDETTETESARFSLDEIKVVKTQAELEEEAKKAAEEAKKKEKKTLGKLPQQPQAASAKDTREAAQEMLKKLFKNK